ncbi:YbhB/YbcL family Raf kinase inhibitor-like protein [Microbacterium sp. X-17]|uniref:YbhB/YbcL family Raf kinase inhibitor-like protein n=1 Tax=Microbacterium sp. X-17 TaxID=3144404 RepID=UPI0031F5B72D
MPAPRDLAVSSPDLAEGHAIADAFSAYGENRTPTITVTGVPDGTAELALIMHDPDAPMPHGFTHWLRYGIAAHATDLSAAAARAGRNDAGTTEYFGPKPPPGHGTHHYYFWVYALDTKVEGEPGREEFLARYGDHVLEMNRLIGTYSRPARA